MIGTDLTYCESLGGSRVVRIQGFSGQAAPGTEALHRLRSLTRLGPSAAQLCADQIRQPAKAQSARHIPCVELGQYRKLPELQPDELRLKLHDFGEQRIVRSGSKLLDHIFDFTGTNNDKQPSTSLNCLANKGETASRQRGSART